MLRNRFAAGVDKPPPPHHCADYSYTIGHRAVHKLNRLPVYICGLFSLLLLTKY